MKKRPTHVLLSKKILLRMKLAIFLLVLIAMQLPASVTMHGQVTLRLENESLRDVFKEIEKQSTYRFFYNEAFADLNKRIHINVENHDINTTMNELLLMSDMSYKVLDNNLIVIAPRKELQQQEITGRVTDAATGESLPGVNVIVQGTTIGIVTNTQGNYSITVPDRDAILVFSFVGYETRQIPLENRSVIDVALQSELLALDEIVVIGYGTQTRANVIGSVTSVRSEELSAAPVSRVSNALAGRLPGAIFMQESGEPGRDEPTIRIRGNATLGNNQPLLVVDGIPNRDINSLHPEDIESITVLKDASAAIYGARAANGVILVTTKRGITDRSPTFSYSFNEGFLSPTRLPEMADAATYATMIREMESYRGTDESNMRFSLDDIAKYESGEFPWTHPNTNWFERRTCRLQ
jgi:TonB-dependent starch-binding outer membrane protein SusC